VKKILITFALFAMLTGSAFAGPIDWMMSKLGYTPTVEIINQRQQAELERLKLQAQIAELQLQQKQIEATARMRLYLLIIVLTSIGLGMYWRHCETVNSFLAGIKIRIEKAFAKREISARSGNEISS
jgi:hypothetical protein